MDGCPSCAELVETEAGRDPWAVARLRAGYVRLHRCQYYPGATFYVARTCVAELHELDAAERAEHLTEMAGVAAAVYEEFDARKMNYEALGNTVAHLHWWLTPRPHDDPRPGGPIWEDPEFLGALATGAVTPEHAAADELRRRLLTALERHGLPIEVAYL